MVNNKIGIHYYFRKFSCRNILIAFSANKDNKILICAIQSFLFYNNNFIEKKINILTILPYLFEFVWLTDQVPGIGSVGCIGMGVGLGFGVVDVGGAVLVGFSVVVVLGLGEGLGAG